jgi:hypothetical protein
MRGRILNVELGFKWIEDSRNHAWASKANLIHAL